MSKLGLSGKHSGAGNGSWLTCHGAEQKVFSPINGKEIGAIQGASEAEYETIVSAAEEAFLQWRRVPAPVRGDVVRQIGDALRRAKKDLGALVSLEVGKIRTEGEGEVQEMIDIADFAVGQSRMLYGLTLHSERPGHRMYEQWHPLGPIGVITAFNFPVAVFAWNAMLALIAGDTIIWKPSRKAPLCAIATADIIWKVLRENHLPDGIVNVIIGNRQTVGDRLLNDRRIPLISATGSVAMGRHVAKTVGSRLGKTLLELGGNNAVIVTPGANLDLAVRAIVFGAVGTAGQRCTTTRRVIAHKDILTPLKEALIRAYRQVSVGDPLVEGTLMGPLIDPAAVATMQSALKKIEAQGGHVLHGGEILTGGLFDTGTYVRPCICEVSRECAVVREETFAPILYLIPFEHLEEAIAIQNEVPQGLSSAIFTQDLSESETFLSHRGSDCGIANVNVGTSGAEIGGAFGGEKDTGGGREAGSDAWKAYMRRQTNTINWSGQLPLAQGIRFDIG
ncbi:MAG: aldehyde dehydrogenase family protein [Pseudomonadota bacterium]